MQGKPDIKCISKVLFHHKPLFVFGPLSVGSKDSGVAKSVSQSISPSITLAQS